MECFKVAPLFWSCRLGEWRTRPQAHAGTQSPPDRGGHRQMLGAALAKGAYALMHILTETQGCVQNSKPVQTT